jgi:hypothetical protein
VQKTKVIDRRWSLVWTGWVVYFGIAEYFALKGRDPKAPFSYYMRHALGIPRTPFHRRAGYVALGSGTVWLITHLYERTTPDE